MNYCSPENKIVSHDSFSIINICNYMSCKFTRLYLRADWELETYVTDKLNVCHTIYYYWRIKRCLVSTISASLGKDRDLEWTKTVLLYSIRSRICQFKPVQRAKRRGGANERTGCSNRWFCFCRRCTLRIPRALPRLRDAFTKIRTQVSGPSIQFFAHAHLFIHRLDNTFVVMCVFFRV